MINLAQFSPEGALGKMIAQAKKINQINEQLKQILPDELNTLEVCLIKDQSATLITNNSAVAFRAQRQVKEILELIKPISALDAINHIEIKVTVEK